MLSLPIDGCESTTSCSRAPNEPPLVRRNRIFLPLKMLIPSVSAISPSNSVRCAPVSRCAMDSMDRPGRRGLSTATISAGTGPSAVSRYWTS